MNALMLVFALFATGPEMMVLAFPSITSCEAGQNQVNQVLIDARASYIAMACVVPVKLDGA